ncbi:MAG: hypothetical protein R6U04_10150 [Bacteroidales bacterium]
MKNYRVIKIGGSNLKTLSDIDRVVDRIQHYDEPLMIVISAFFGVTGQLNNVLDRTENIYRHGKDFITKLRDFKHQVIACIAYAVDAVSLDLWKDVEGFLNADPNVIENVRRVPRLTYDEAGEMAYFGSDILHPLTVEPVRVKKIPIRIFDIRDDQYPLQPKTIITSYNKKTANIVKGIAHCDDFGVVRLNGASIGVKPDVLSKIASRLDQYKINIKSVLTSQTTINILTERSDNEKVKRVLKNVEIDAIENISIVNDISVVALVGEGLKEHDGIAAKIFTSIAKRRINIEMLCFGASPVAVYFVINSKYEKDTIKAVHEDLFLAENTVLESNIIE